MGEARTQWWVFVAVAIGLAELGAATVNLVQSMLGEGEPFATTLLGLFAGIALAGLAVGGALVRRRPGRRFIGGIAIAVAVAPGSMLVPLYWFPPAAIAGLLCVTVAVLALGDAFGHRVEVRPAVAGPDGSVRR